MDPLLNRYRDTTWTFKKMTAKEEGNIVGTVMFLVFLTYPVAKDAWDAIMYLVYEAAADRHAAVEGMILLISTALLGFMFWVIFDSSWLNYDDEEKETEWATMRWIKFSVLFALPVMKLFKKSTSTSDNMKWGLEVAKQLQSFLMLLVGYFSLCSDYKSGLGRLFQPFTVPRSRVYTDEKGQKFEVNFIGSTLTIVLILLPTWNDISESLGRMISFITLDKSTAVVEVAVVDQYRYIQNSPGSRAIADAAMLILYLYVFILMLTSCMKVTYFLRQTKMNYLIFIPVLLIPIGIIFTDHLCIYGIQTVHGGIFWTKMLCYFLVNLTAYISLISPPDSLLAVLFQPHVPMINVVSDLPNTKVDDSNSRPHATAVFAPEKHL